MKKKNKKIILIFGTRPEIIKMSPVIRLCRKKAIPFATIHTGQHYSYEMDKIFFDELRLPSPDYQLEIKSSAPHRQGEHTGRMMAEIENVLLHELPKAVLVHGDTNSALAGALTSSKIATTKEYTKFDIKLGHVEAGLRSYDRTMPEELNRIISDHLSDYLFAPTQEAKGILISEAVPEKKIHVTGNTIVDAVRQNLELARRKSDLLRKLAVKKKGYFLLTLHRQENVNVKKKFADILNAFGRLKKRFAGYGIIFPMHPRTQRLIKEFGFKLPANLKVIEPVSFLEFLQLEKEARLVMTDSGGVQEESCILGVPCVTIRDNTERPETLQVGSNALAGTEPENIVRCVRQMFEKRPDWKNPFGDGSAAEKIIKAITR